MAPDRAVAQEPGHQRAVSVEADERDPARRLLAPDAARRPCEIDGRARVARRRRGRRLARSKREHDGMVEATKQSERAAVEEGRPEAAILEGVVTEAEAEAALLALERGTLDELLGAD